MIHLTNHHLWVSVVGWGREVTQTHGSNHALNLFCPRLSRRGVQVSVQHPCMCQSERKATPCGTDSSSHTPGRSRAEIFNHFEVMEPREKSEKYVKRWKKKLGYVEMIMVFHDLNEAVPLLGRTGIGGFPSYRGTPMAGSTPASGTSIRICGLGRGYRVPIFDGGNLGTAIGSIFPTATPSWLNAHTFSPFSLLAWKSLRSNRTLENVKGIIANRWRLGKQLLKYQVSSIIKNMSLTWTKSTKKKTIVSQCEPNAIHFCWRYSTIVSA